MHVAGVVERFEEHFARLEDLGGLIVDGEAVLPFEHVTDHKSRMAMLSSRRRAAWNRDFGRGHLPAIEIHFRRIFDRDRARWIRSRRLPFDSHVAAFSRDTLAQDGGENPRR